MENEVCASVPSLKITALTEGLPAPSKVMLFWSLGGIPLKPSLTLSDCAENVVSHA